jgi:hypothetical protein
MYRETHNEALHLPPMVRPAPTPEIQHLLNLLIENTDVLIIENQPLEDTIDHFSDLGFTLAISEAFSCFLAIKQGDDQSPATSYFVLVYE